jgi:hypothetical protein
VLYPNAPFGWLPSDYRQMRVVRGASMSTIMRGGGDPTEWLEGPRKRPSFSTDRAYVGLGFRCARSAAPEYLSDELKRALGRAK